LGVISGSGLSTLIKEPNGSKNGGNTKDAEKANKESKKT
jgi:hypothetical protein